MQIDSIQFKPTILWISSWIKLLYLMKLGSARNGTRVLIKHLKYYHHVYASKCPSIILVQRIAMEYTFLPNDFLLRWSIILCKVHYLFFLSVELLLLFLHFLLVTHNIYL